MQLKQQPVTEAEYFAVINCLDRYSDQSFDDFGESTNGIFYVQGEQALVLLYQLISELAQFGVMDIRNSPSRDGKNKDQFVLPVGKIWYWDWYAKMHDGYDKQPTRIEMCQMLQTPDSSPCIGCLRFKNRTFRA